MFIAVTDDAVGLEDSWDTSAFHVTTTTDDVTTGRLLRRHGAGDLGGNGSAHIAVTFVLEAAGELAIDKDWRHRFDTMLDYARSKGWITADGDIAAHVVSSEA